MKALNLRLDPDLYDAVDTIALVREQTVTDAIRDALTDHINEHRKNPDFQERAAITMARKLGHFGITGTVVIEQPDASTTEVRFQPGGFTDVSHIEPT